MTPSSPTTLLCCKAGRKAVLRAVSLNTKRCSPPSAPGGGCSLSLKSLLHGNHSEDMKRPTEKPESVSLSQRLIRNEVMGAPFSVTWQCNC